MAVKKGDFVKIHYTGRMRDSDEVIDTTRKEVAEEHGLNVKPGPVVIVVGAGMVWEPVEEALMGSEPGDELEVEVPREKAFGKRDPSLVRTYRKSEFEGSVKPGDTVVSPDGRRGRVLSVDGGRVRVDFNHPLAGKTLTYEVEVVDVLKDTMERAEGLLETMVPSVDAELELDGNTLRVRVEGDDTASPAWARAKQRFAKLMMEYDDAVEEVVFEERFTE
ncbi:FKBP-type peptidyl-prolyl cis-trans isomerase [Methanopyrus sp.]